MSGSKIWTQPELTCKPLDTLEEVESFLQDPPIWRSLCKEIKRHSQNVVRNCDINAFFGENVLESPQSFCHYESEAENVEHHDRKKLPKTLVCHDMANGYHDDCYIDGTGNYDAYTFYNWGAIDIFCYFSHHFITIPPLGWINVGHEHGVKVIGTVITEWGDGVALWDKILSSEAESANFASALVAIASTLKLDGWLLNVENKIAKPQELLQFIRTLHDTLHQELEDPVLIWYDSVTVEGHLNWQNGLNEKNKDFFDVVDGFFTNYSWSEKDIETSAAHAGDRLADLYIGIDVWGRNFYGGGQFNTQQAIKMAYNYGCSLAIFAQAWTHEAMSEEPDNINSVVNSKHLDKYEKFLLRDRAFWCSIWPYLCTKLPTELPFQTSFCRGQGKKRRLYGEVICPVPWYNLRHMQYQPNSALGPHGYLLSTQENIMGISRLGILKNKAGILKCRRSFGETEVELTEKKTTDVAITVKKGGLTIVTQEETVEITSDESETSAKKTKIIDVLRNFFRVKTKTQQSNERKRKRSMDEEDRRELETREIEIPETNEIESQEISERSMVQMSVQLKLGEKTERTRYVLAYVSKELECLEPFFEDSFLGGSCLKINPSDEVCTEHRLSRLFHCDFFCEDSLIACVVTKIMEGHEHQFLNVKLYIQNNSQNYKEIVLVGRDIPHGRGEASAAEIMNLYPLSNPSDPEFRDMQKYMVLNEPDFYVSVANAYGWNVRYYQIDLPGSRVTTVNVRTGLSVGPILLGYIGFCARRRTETNHFS